MIAFFVFCLSGGIVLAQTSSDSSVDDLNAAKNERQKKLQQLNSQIQTLTTQTLYIIHYKL